MEGLVTEEQIYLAIRPILELACTYGNGSVDLNFSTDLHVYEVSAPEACSFPDRLDEAPTHDPESTEGSDQ